MVYYIGIPNEIGQYPVEKFLDGDTRQVVLRGPLTPEMRSEIALNKTHQFNIGLPVEAANVPTIWQWASSRPIPDYYTPHGFPCISQRMKSIIECFEPGVHQFFPLDVVNKKGDQLAERFLWVVCNWIDSVDREHTTLVLRHGRLWVHPKHLSDEELPIGYSRKSPIKLAFNEGKIGEHHFWRDKYLMGKMILVSNDAERGLFEAGLSGLTFRKAGKA